MTVEEIGRRMSSREFTRWREFYRLEDAAKAGKLDELEHSLEARRDDT